ncbi:MAG: nucleotidyltransferase family protein [Bacteroidales bacterium]|nr:nucleotidyltransferase family protein [Bacteroidales bacterium]
MMEAIVLAGGFGTRLRTVVSDMPKPMAPVAGRPFLEYLLDTLKQQGYSHVVLSTGYMHEKIADHFGHEYNGIRLDYAREETPLGTGGAIVNALQHCTSECVTVLNGDTMFRIDHRHFIEQASQNGGRLSIVTRKVDDAGRYGLVESDPSTGRITAFREKDPSIGSGHINGGIYRLHRSLLAPYPLGSTFSFEKEVMQPLGEPFYAYASDGYFIDIVVPEDYARAQTELPAL